MDEFEGFDEAGINVYLEECNTCGRKFNFDALERHQKVCTNLKKRKPFESKKQRLQGIGVETVKKAPAEPKKVSRKANWRAQHEEFISTIRAARGVTAAIKSGNPLPPPPPATVNPDYVKCPHCNRNFNAHAAERHMPFCKEQKTRIAHNSLGPNAAREKQAKRTQYRPPLPGRRDTGGATTSPAKTKTSSSADAHGRYGNTEIPQSNRVANKTFSAPAKGSTRPIANSTRANPQGRSPQKPSYSSPTALDKNKQRVSSGSSTSDSENTTKKQFKKEPQWYEEMMRSNTGPSQQHQQHHELDHHPDSGIIATDGAHNAERRVHSGRRRAENHNISDPYYASDNRNAATVGVVRPSSYHSSPPPVQTNSGERKTLSGRTRLAKFCYECGTRYPVETAKFCCECGIRRVHIGG